MENKADHALSLMIKFCLFEEDCFPVLKNHFGNDCYNSALSNYQSNYKRYVHRYVALSHIYHSLINCSSLFDMNVRLYLRKQITVREEQLDRFSRAMHESFVQQLFIQYAKLAEALIDDIPDDGKDPASHHDKYRDLITRNNLEEVYLPLLRLLKKIKDSSIQTLRNKIFAHPFKDTKKVIAFSSHIAVEEIYKTLRVLCDEDKKDQYDKEVRKVLFFTNSHIIKGEKSRKHLYIIYEFMKKLRMNAFLNIDPYINLERQEAIDMIKTSLLINTPLIVQQRQNTLKLQ